VPGEAELRKAVRVSMSGDRKPLELFFARGGKVSAKEVPVVDQKVRSQVVPRKPNTKAGK